MIETRKITATISTTNFVLIQNVKAELQKDNVKNISFSEAVDRIIDAAKHNDPFVEKILETGKK